MKGRVFMGKSEHSGHRSRMRKRFIDYGGESFETHEILEMLLYYAYPMKDTNPIAHRLLDRFGSLSNLLDSPYNALVEADLTDNVATYLKLLPEMFSRYSYDRFCSDHTKLTVKNINEMIITKFVGKTDENVYLLLLNTKYNPLFSNFINQGNHSHAEIDISKICDYAVRYKAKYAIIAHNHPSGILIPSRADIRSTARLYETLNVLNVELLNHYIVAEGSCLGLKEVKSFFKSVAEFDNSNVDVVYNAE